jgi:hypothetical protein
MNSEITLTKKTNPKLIRSFASDPVLEAVLKKTSSETGRSISSIVRDALRKLFYLDTP